MMSAALTCNNGNNNKTASQSSPIVFDQGIVIEAEDIFLSGVKCGGRVEFIDENEKIIEFTLSAFHDKRVSVKMVDVSFRLAFFLSLSSSSIAAASLSK